MCLSSVPLYPICTGQSPLVTLERLQLVSVDGDSRLMQWGPAGQRRISVLASVRVMQLSCGSVQDTKMADAAPATKAADEAMDGDVRSNGPSEVSTFGGSVQIVTFPSDPSC